jgi:hypothetical protein
MRAQLIYNTSYAQSNKVVILSSYTPKQLANGARGQEKAEKSFVVKQNKKSEILIFF